MKIAHRLFPAVAAPPAFLMLGLVMLSLHAPAADALTGKATLMHPRVTDNFDADWKFFQGDPTNAQMPHVVDRGPTFDDSDWRDLNLPHDWSIEGPFAETNKAGGAGAFLPSGVAWYRKHFAFPSDFDKGSSVFIEFDGVMANSDVWINGYYLGHRPYGYTSFRHKLDGHLNFDGADNVIAVRCDTSEQPASRWYAGAGIYRHVRLITTGPLNVEYGGTFVSTPQVSAKAATVRVQTTVTNGYGAGWQTAVWVELIDPKGKVVADADSALLDIKDGTCVTFTNDFVVKNPQLWDLKNPSLYRAHVLAHSGEIPFDDDTVSFGIRAAHFDPTNGFSLNGKHFKIYGVAVHEDGGAFGMAVPVSVWEERLKTLKSLGVNAIRTAHNPPAPEFLDLCDRMGVLVMDEFFDCWTVAKNPFDYHLYFTDWSSIDAADTVRRDRNHPSVILWSIGNEIHDTPKPEIAIPIASNLVQVCHENDPTRPVTQALFRPNVSHDYDDGLASLLDVVGTNYRDNELLAAQRAHPTWKIIGTEQRHDRQTWLWLRDNPSHSGQFLWTGVDYLGESRRWPRFCANSGLLDRTGEIKPLGLERESWWSVKPVVSAMRRTGASTNAPVDPGFAPLERPLVLFADWTPTNSAPHKENVEVYSNCKEVELFLNGKSLGKKEINADAAPRNWFVPFAPGTLKAVARNEKGSVVATDELQTAGAPAKIILSTETKKLSPGFENVALVRATIVDAKGVAVPRADNLITFQISGSGEIAAVDNADNSSHESFQASERRAFHSECVAFVKTTEPSGKIKLTATADGLKADSITIQAAK
jgi:beta-galactosidase